MTASRPCGTARRTSIDPGLRNEEVSPDAERKVEGACKAHSDDLHRIANTGPASKNRGRFEMVQYRRNPTFLRRVSQRKTSAEWRLCLPIHSLDPAVNTGQSPTTPRSRCTLGQAICTVCENLWDDQPQGYNTPTQDNDREPASGMTGRTLCQDRPRKNQGIVREQEPADDAVAAD